MRIKIRYFTPFSAVHQHRAEHHAMRNQRQCADCHLASVDQQLGLALGRRLRHRLRRCRVVKTAALVVAASSVAAAVLVAPTATAAPRCVDISPRTTQCEGPGHAQIRTTPPPISPYIRFGCTQGFTSFCDWGFPGSVVP